MEFKNYYKIMGISPEASQDTIRQAYRRLAHRYHPDVSALPDAEDRFKEIGEAYEVLKDPEKRATYEKFRRRWSSGHNSTSSHEQAGSGAGARISPASEQTRQQGSGSTQRMAMSGFVPFLFLVGAFIFVHFYNPQDHQTLEATSKPVKQITVGVQEVNRSEKANSTSEKKGG